MPNFKQLHTKRESIFVKISQVLYALYYYDFYSTLLVHNTFKDFISRSLDARKVKLHIALTGKITIKLKLCMNAKCTNKMTTNCFS